MLSLQLSCGRGPERRLKDEIIRYGVKVDNVASTRLSSLFLIAIRDHAIFVLILDIRSWGGNYMLAETPRAAVHTDALVPCSVR